MYKKGFKRFLDITISLLLLLLCLLPFIVIAIAIRIDSKGNILFIQERIGQNREPFKIIKFRTMVFNAPSLGGSSTLSNDPRITKVGAILRKLSLDELPQLINVFKGDMSLIGYRPDVDANLDYDYQVVYTLKPGITGLAQVSGRSLLNTECKTKLEIEYAKNISFLLDLKILLKTIPVLLNTKVSN
ncbi:sugar transferase [Actinobacillus delphinicola]|uniref:Undecaprenyl-galactosyl transferase n=1 Tax=Actinobacillus delphinicola TaxID=51161 RepID=A0A448TV64_9PAST|nr:sugar transferase [Actinobacillus delphinicola]VEJ09836.1 undecaprenyl-galactosyl transferase [Actinobacillus delphinicola]